VNWALRVYVPKGEALIVFINNGGRDFFRDDLVENGRVMACGSSIVGKKEGVVSRGRGVRIFDQRAKKY